MALLRNREVSLLGATGGEDPTQLFTVQDKDGNKEQASLKDLTLSEKEHADLTKQHGERLSSQTKKVSDKDYQDIVDKQNPDKIKANQKKNPPDTTPVQVPVMVNPADVAKAQ